MLGTRWTALVGSNTGFVNLEIRLYALDIDGCPDRLHGRVLRSVRKVCNAVKRRVAGRKNLGRVLARFILGHLCVADVGCTRAHSLAPTAPGPSPKPTPTADHRWSSPLRIVRRISSPLRVSTMPATGLGFLFKRTRKRSRIAWLILSQVPSIRHFLHLSHQHAHRNHPPGRRGVTSSC